VSQNCHCEERSDKAIPHVAESFSFPKIYLSQLVIKSPLPLWERVCPEQSRRTKERGMIVFGTIYFIKKGLDCQKKKG
jgi:hypothetical protein